jgi:YegS/Rv2252/BmrU family lipid kinase
LTSPAGRIGVIINPVSGTGGRPEIARRRRERAAAELRARGLDGELVCTERHGHGGQLAAAMLDQGLSLIVAWGGDGTVNEIASVLAFRDATLAIVPSGSGNGLARELGIPRNPAGAFDVAFTGRERLMDAGELDRRLFFNIAGIGLDARVAHEFAVGGLVRRGFARYLELTVRELFAYEADDHTIVADGDAFRTRALMIAIANSRQYGNGATIAPRARIDDGLLDVIVVADRSPWAALLQMPKLFTGRVDRVPGVTMRTARHVEVISARPVVYHVDGEPFVGGASLSARIRPQALRVRCPRAAH